MKNAIFVEPHNCPERVIIDTLSEDFNTVVGQAKKAIVGQGKLAYIWRRNEHQVSHMRQGVIEGVFAPMLSCLRSWDRERHSSKDITFQFHDTLNYSLANADIEYVSIAAAFRVQTFFYNGQRERKNFGLMLPENVIRRGDLVQTDLNLINVASYPVDRMQADKPHVDGTKSQTKEAELFSLDKIYLRMITVIQGGGTFFWGESVADLGGQCVLLDGNNFVDPAYLEAKQAFQSKAGDVLIFRGLNPDLSQAFVHQACHTSEASSLQHPDITKLRLVEVCDLELHL